MARGVMLCGVMHAGARAPGVPKSLRKHFPPEHDLRRFRELPDDLRASLRHVKPYTRHEVQRALEFYALVGHMQNAALDEPLRTGELATKVALMTSGVAEDVFTACEQM